MSRSGSLVGFQAVRDDGHRCVSPRECTNGIEALAAIERHSPDVLFVDVQLPDVPGFQALESSSRKISALVFMSAFDRFAARAFDAQVL